MTGATGVHIAYLTPVYPPAIGGGAVYVSMLARELPARGACSRMTVITEAYPGAPAEQTSADGKLDVRRPFLFRAGKSTRGLGSYVAYAVQNLQLLGLARDLAGVKVLFVHGSFFNNPGLIEMSLRRVRRSCPGIRLVLDLRDPLFPEQLVSKAARFDAVISCSRNISDRLPGATNLRDIPVMIADRSFTDAQKDEVVRKHGLEGRNYVFNGSGFHAGKGSEQLLELVRSIRQSGRDIVLAIAGKRRLWTAQMETASKEGWLFEVGMIASEEVRALASASWLDANLSTVDSFPRHSIEALASGARVLLPAGVPEFQAACPDFVADVQGDALVQRAIAIAEEAGKQCPYPWRQHLPDAVMAQYLELIQELVAK